MNKTVIIVSIVSILFNLLFIFLGLLFIFKKGGWPYLVGKLNAIDKNSDVTNYYLDKTSHFELLPIYEGDIIFLGDSITDYWEWTELFRDMRVKNRGISGDTTKGVLNRLDGILKSKPGKIFLMIGINDFILKGRSNSETINHYRAILAKIKQETPNTKVFVQSVLPIIEKPPFTRNVNNESILKFNLLLKDLAESFGYQYIDLFSAFLDSTDRLDSQYTLDGVHLNGRSYLVWREKIEKYVLE